ncbi:hypothetical protein EJ03DRAFT_353531 [Teratosphaeria nubilosa]|uniref:BTB domain-containing protein n=1 Tax=Teratosphaeria nubilosa TaxID=161662 RepID=A0A6G1L373_9PEZI|nr:hypothetical protein EJ03DRAFT_353531 [Teratosphaeria nubilosa]
MPPASEYWPNSQTTKPTPNSATSPSPAARKMESPPARPLPPLPGASEMEAKSRRVDLSDQDPACVEGLIHYLYRLSYGFTTIIKYAKSPLLYHVQMCVLADKYDVQPLKQLAAARFKEMAKKEYAGAQFAEAAAEAFEVAGATAEICEAVAELAVEHRLLAPSNGDGAELRGVAKGCPEMLMAVLGRMQEVGSDVRKEGPELQVEVRYKCPGCDFSFSGKSFEFRCGGRSRSDVKLALGRHDGASCRLGEIQH